jgi:hypothetical protein
VNEILKAAERISPDKNYRQAVRKSILDMEAASSSYPTVTVNSHMV